MAMRNMFSLIAFLCVFSVTQTSFIWLNNGSYEDIVFAINPDLQEDDTLIQKIKEMVKDASAYLFSATENRLAIGNVKILIPLTWTSKSNYVVRTKESYEKADIIISHPIVKYGDNPYTVQYRGCGEQGEYIHLTPNYLLNTSLSLRYGSPGRTFVHEWAHFRWGVFDEYNAKIPYYISGELKVEATRCSSSLKGSNMIQECEGDSCSLRECNIDSNSGLYEEGCLFWPEKDQNVQESIMYSVALPSIRSFCNDSNHNIEAPSLQNRMCNSRSTWDIIMNSADIISTPPRPDTDLPVPTFTLMQYKSRVITLVCDISGSMARSGRIGRLFQGAEFFLTQIVETGAYVGIVEFSTFAFAISKLVHVNTEEDRATLASLIPSTTLNEGGDICLGILEALKVNKELDGSAAGTEILLASDDDESNIEKCTGDISASGVVIHIIAFGSEASKQLEHIADLTGGQKHFASDTSNANDLFHAFSMLSSQNGDVAQQTILLESRSSDLESGGCLNSTIFIDSTVGTSTFFLVTWQTTVPSIRLQDPIGNRYNEAQFTNNTRSHSSRLQILGRAKTGAWNYTLCNTLNANQVLGMLVTSKAATENDSPVTINAHMNKDTNDYPDPMIIYTSVRKDLLPVTNLNVTAIVEAESGHTVTVQLLDNGAGADVFKNDGVYSRYLTSFSENGRYNLKVHVETQEIDNRLTLPRNEVLYISEYIENGIQSTNPLRPPVNNEDLRITVSHISTIASGGSFIINNVPTTPQAIIYKPCKITDLEANAQGNSVVLSWTAPGDDLDQGQALQYDLRMSMYPRHLRDYFKNATLINISSLTPQQYGSREKFTFVPNSMAEKNRIVLYFALTAINKDNQESDISNIAQTVILNSPTPESSTVLSETSHASTSFQTGTSVSPSKTNTKPDTMSTPASAKFTSTGTSNTDLYSTIKTSDSTKVEMSSSSRSSHSIPTDYPQPASSTDLPDVDTTTDRTVSLATNSLPSVSISSATSNNSPFTGTPTGSLITPNTNIDQPTNSTNSSDVNTLTPIYSTTLPTDNTLSPVSNYVPSVSKFPSSADTLTPTVSTRNSNDYTVTMTDNSVTLTSFKTGNTIRQTDKSDSGTVTKTLITNNTTTISPSTSTSSSSQANINVTVVVVVVCVAAVIVSILICLAIYFAKYSRSGSYSSTIV